MSVNILSGGEPSALCLAFADYLNCDCDYFPTTDNPAPIAAAFDRAVTDGEARGYIPVLMAVDDNLAEAIALNVSGDTCFELADLDRDTIVNYRKRLTEQAAVSTADGYFAQIKECWGVSPRGEITGGVALHEPELPTPCCETLLAKIPAAEPWEVAAWLPMGNWNDCPVTEVMVAVAKKWYEQYGAVIGWASGDTLGFRVKQPLDDTKTASALAEEHELFCKYCLANTPSRTCGAWCDSLTQSTVWPFWWD